MTEHEDATTRGTGRTDGVTPTRASWTRWGVPALAVMSALGAYVARGAVDGGAHSAVLFVGSRTTAAFLDCRAQIRSDVSRDPAVVVVSGGELAGYEVLRDSFAHAPHSAGLLDIVGLSIGAPSLARLGASSGSPADRWVALPLFDRYPLGLVVAEDVAPTLEPIARPCGSTGENAVTRCVRPAKVRELLRAEHESRAHGPRGRFLMVPDSAGGTWEALDRLIWPKGEDSTPEWIEPDARFRIDLNDVAARPHAVAFGLPPSGAGLCEPPFGVKQFGICDADGDDGSPCHLAEVSLYAYTRAPSECVEARPCRLHEPVCSVLQGIYARLPATKARAWASTCALPDHPGGPGALIVPF